MLQSREERFKKKKKKRKIIVILNILKNYKTKLKKLNIFKNNESRTLKNSFIDFTRVLIFNYKS